VFSIEDMIRLFDIADVNKSASAFDGEKLAWLNQQHMMHAPAARLVAPLRWHLEQGGVHVPAHEDARLEQIAIAQRERSKTLKEMAANSRFFFRPPEGYDGKALAKHVNPAVLEMLAAAAADLDLLTSWTAADIHRLISELAEKYKMNLGKVAQPLRLAMCGGTVSPPIDATLSILGREEVLSRLRTAIAAWRGTLPP
jgi:glutamyl-tRNA synthetase